MFAFLKRLDSNENRSNREIRALRTIWFGTALVVFFSASLVFFVGLSVIVSSIEKFDKKKESRYLDATMENIIELQQDLERKFKSR